MDTAARPRKLESDPNYWARLVIVVAVFVAGCATAPAPPPGEHFHDALFAAPAKRPDAGEIFAASAEMKEYLGGIADLLASRGRQRGLYEALYSTGALKLRYDAATTRNAAQAFEARSGNCLSLAVMTATLARELGLEVRFQRVHSEEAWSRSGDLYVSSGHLNVTLGRRSGDPRMRFEEANLLTIDFFPLTEKQRQQAWEVGERTVAAMFMNNRAAETLAAGRLDEAYWWAREAIVQDPRFLAAYNTLGVVYRRHGYPAEAARVLESVVAREPGNLHALSNLALALRDQGRHAEAEAIALRLARLQPEPPFHFFNRGLEAMGRGDYAAARELFEREVERDAYYHEFHFWLAVAYVRLGQPRLARRHLIIAIDNSATAGERALYAAKLGKL
jgi:tetratricopeptide (TPR) repeat protein